MAGNQRGNSFGPMKKTKNNKQPTLFSLLKNQNTFVLELNSKRNKVIDLTENESPTGDLTKRQKIIHVPAPSPEKLKSSSSKIPKPVDNKKTLDKWFTRVTKREETKNKEKETVVIESTIKKKHFSRNLIQRMIKKKDTCRVCNETNTEIETRCNARCVGCDMTVHKSCYELDELPPDNEWFCRSCKYLMDQNALPMHKPLHKDDGIDDLYSDSNFAAVLLFLRRFQDLGLKTKYIGVQALALALLESNGNDVLEELHLRLLTNIGVNPSKKRSWDANVLHYLDGKHFKGEHITFVEGVNVYYTLPLSVRVEILKYLCEIQFDKNETMLKRIGDRTMNEDIRETPIAEDSQQRSYWLIKARGCEFLLCRCSSTDGSNWETLCDDFESLESFIDSVSYLTKTADLTLWKILKNGFFKDLQKEIKKQQRAQLRMSRILRCEEAAMNDDEGIPQRRSLRNRRSVNYSMLDEDVNDEDDEQYESSSRDELEEEPIEKPVPSRVSRRLRGMNANDKNEIEESKVSEVDTSSEDQRIQEYGDGKDDNEQNSEESDAFEAESHSESDDVDNSESN